MLKKSSCFCKLLINRSYFCLEIEFKRDFQNVKLPVGHICFFFFLIIILDVHATSGDWLSSLHTSDCQSEPGIPECELYNVNLSVSLLAVYLYQLLSCLLIKEAINSEQCTYRFLRRGGSRQPISIASTLSSVACAASY